MTTTTRPTDYGLTPDDAAAALNGLAIRVDAVSGDYIIVDGLGAMWGGLIGDGAEADELYDEVAAILRAIASAKEVQEAR